MPEAGDLHLHAHACDEILQRTTQGCFSRCQSCGSGVKSEFFGQCLECHELLPDLKPGDSGKAPLLVDSATSVWRSPHDIPQAPVAVGNHAPIPFAPAPTCANRPRSSSSSDDSCHARSPRRSPTSPYRTQRSQRGRPPNGSRQPAAFKGVRQRTNAPGYQTEIRPFKWKKTIWLGTYSTDREAAGAYDAGIYYTSKKTKFNFPQLEGSFPPLPVTLRFDNVDDSKEIKTFVKKEAKIAAQKVKSLPPPATTTPCNDNDPRRRHDPRPPAPVAVTTAEETSQVLSGLNNIPCYFDDDWTLEGFSVDESLWSARLFSEYEILWSGFNQKQDDGLP